MTSRLRIDLSHKTEGVQFSGTPPLNYLTSCIVICLFERKTLKFEADTLFYTNLSSNCQNLPNITPTVNNLPNSTFLSGIIAPKVCSLFKYTTVV